MTLVYQQYYEAYDLDRLSVEGVEFNVKLVSEGYTPDASHKPADVDEYIINGLGTLVDNDIVTKGMGELIEKAKAKMVIGFESFPDEICAEVDKVFTDNEPLKELIRNFSGDWDGLKDHGIKYFVVENPYLTINTPDIFDEEGNVIERLKTGDSILCWCEEI